MNDNEITEEEIIELKKLAKNATEGPWDVYYNTIISIPLAEEYARLECSLPENATDEDLEKLNLPNAEVVGWSRKYKLEESEKDRKNAQFIAAANPDKILRLIKKMEKLKYDYNKLLFDKMNSHNNK